MPDSRPSQPDADPGMPDFSSPLEIERWLENLRYADRSADPGMPDFSSPLEIERWLENLRYADRSLYNLMALEVWAIAKTMDGRIPGFWSRFMDNRQAALKQFMQHKQLDRNPASTDSPSDPTE